MGIGECGVLRLPGLEDWWTHLGRGRNYPACSVSKQSQTSLREMQGGCLVPCHSKNERYAFHLFFIQRSIKVSTESNQVHFKLATKRRTRISSVGNG